MTKVNLSTADPYIIEANSEQMLFLEKLTGKKGEKALEHFGFCCHYYFMFPEQLIKHIKPSKL